MLADFEIFGPVRKHVSQNSGQFPFADQPKSVDRSDARPSTEMLITAQLCEQGVIDMYLVTNDLFGDFHAIGRTTFQHPL